MQAFKVGQMLRERYKNFLNDKYSSEDVYARSSENPRTRMTLQLVLAGLFPPTKELRWNPKLDWMPIAYSYSPTELDALLKSQLTKKFYKLYDDLFETSYGIETLASNKDIFDLLDKHNYKVSTTTVTDLAAVHNILLIHERLHLPLPDWYTDNIKQRFAEIFELYHDTQSYTKEMKRLNGGPIIKTFINNMNLNKTTKDPKKLYLYSGHDLNVGAVIRALNARDFHNSDFCSTLILEKLRDSRNQVYVKLLHWDAIKEEMETVRIGDCDEICPIDKFLEHTRDVIPTEEELFSMYDEYDINYVKKFFV
ncbi:venom acid phosphatase Acph-1-like isoform X2 [Phymastichus coffea]|nr:venom acid phosphatase Acph-1-like isoform X2 [Phymastichus coffea]